jgi:hypothetical protein
MKYKFFGSISYPKCPIVLHMNASDKEINMAAGCNGIKNDANTRYPASMIASNVCTELVANGVGSVDK